MGSSRPNSWPNWPSRRSWCRWSTPPTPRPSRATCPRKALADFVRCRDLTCRWPGCDRPAYDCDVDHTIPYADGGPTHASNLKCYCRTHHLVKTFWGWRDRQLPDGTVILTSPAGTDLCHHTRAAHCCFPVCASHQRPAHTRSRPAVRLLRRTHRDDAQTPPHPRPRPRPPRRHRTPTKPRRPHQPPGRPPELLRPGPTERQRRRTTALLTAGQRTYLEATANNRHSPGTPLSS